MESIKFEIILYTAVYLKITKTNFKNKKIFIIEENIILILYNIILSR